MELGLGLILLKDLHDDETIQENYGSFNQSLAVLHLNPRRIYDLVGNAQYLVDTNTPKKYWKHLDSSVIKLLRKHKISPTDMLDDIKTLSWNDLVKSVTQTAR